MAKKLAYFTQIAASFLHKVDNNIGFREKRQLFRRRLAKIGKIVVITSTPGLRTNL
jgi:hypothetical protein